MITDDTIQILTLVFRGLSAIAAIIGAGGIVYAVKTFKFNTWLKAQAIYVNNEFYNARKDILSHFGFKAPVPSRIGQGDEESAILVCQKMDELARLKSYVGKKEIIETWGIPMGKSWMILRETVLAERKQSHDRKWDAFQRLAEIAIKKYNLEELNKKLVSYN